MTIESIGYRPSGSMCMVCAKHPHDCGLLVFSQMPQMKRDPDGTIVVKCTEFRRKEQSK